MAKRLVLALLFVTAVGVAGSLDARTAPEALFVDKIHGATTMWVPYEYYDSRIVGVWGNQVCIATSSNVNNMRCDTLDLVDFYEDPQGNFFVKLSYARVVGQGFWGLYPFRGQWHGFWFGLPCNGGYIKSFLYPNPPNPFDFQLDITSLPAGNLDVC